MRNTDDQIDKRCRHDTDTWRGIVAALQTLFDQHNELIRLFRSALNQIPADDYRVVVRADQRPLSQHERRYNEPTSGF